MTTPLLVQPASGGRISGGFLYNLRMAEEGLWQLLDVQPERLSDVASLSPEQPLLMDSIWLTPEHAQPFLRLAARGQRVGLLLHSFPSLIAAAEAGHATPMAPSAFELATLARLGLVLVPGRHYASIISRTGARLVLAEPGLDAGWRAPPRPRQGRCRLVSVGAVTPRKGFLDIVEILLRRSDIADYEWRILGSLAVDPAYAARVRERSAALPGVQLLGQLPPSDVQHQLRSADLLLMPSYDENQPLVLLEAMAASVPSIAYDAGAARQMLQHEREGLITPIGDQERFGACLAQLLADEGRRQALAAACWQRQQSLPSWPAAAARARQELSRVWPP